VFGGPEAPAGVSQLASVDAAGEALDAEVRSRCTVLGGPSQMSEQDDLVLETFRRYVRAFETLRPEAVVPYYHEPCVFISSQGVATLHTGADVVAFFTNVMAGLHGDGYASSEFPDLQVLGLSDALTMVRGVGSWKRADGTELRHFGLTYMLRKGDTGWRIVVAVVHDP
jgi:ketosteroid isomerase-like protein